MILTLPTSSVNCFPSVIGLSKNMDATKTLTSTDFYAFELETQKTYFTGLLGVSFLPPSAASFFLTLRETIFFTGLQ